MDDGWGIAPALRKGLVQACARAQVGPCGATAASGGAVALLVTDMPSLFVRLEGQHGTSKASVYAPNPPSKRT